MSATGPACPLCDHGNTRVTDSRRRPGGGTRRRRECAACGHRYSTHETVMADNAMAELVSLAGLPDHVRKAIRILVGEDE